MAPQKQELSLATGSRPERGQLPNRLTGVARDQVERLLALRHPDPHSILGAHATERGVIIRAYRPGAQSVRVLVDDRTPVDMVRCEGDLFEVVVENRRDVFRYLLEVHYPGGHVFKVRQPYSFLPTLGELDIYLWAEETHQHIHERLGAHVREMEGIEGVAFAVWAPNAAGVSVVGNFNSWDGRLAMMRLLGSSGIWELFIPELGPGTIYKYEVRARDGGAVLKADPFASATEIPPRTASVVYQSRYEFRDQEWMRGRGGTPPLDKPVSVYEVHLGSWRRVPEEGNRALTYREMATRLVDYVADLGFTHVEFLPVMEHPFGASWGYQVTSYFAPTARFGEPDDLRFLIDELHRRGVGVILDWVPAHYPKDAWSLGRFDGTALFEHADPRQGEHPEWGTYIFNFGRDEVRSFLLASAENWLANYHADGLRVDAVSSMLYLDYGRRDGEWIPNVFGGRENLEAISLLKRLNEQTQSRHPGVLMIAEESTSWPNVSRPTYLNGLGFGFKWNMGWMHDTLDYFSEEAVYRRYHHNHLTFGLLYAWSENFILPLSHDEVVYGKRSLLSKMPGDDWQKFANLRALYGYMWAMPGKKMIFMGSEFGQWNEWNYNASLDWHLLEHESHQGIQKLIHDLNLIYRREPALHECDCEESGFRWIAADSADDNVIAFMRLSPKTGRRIVCVCSFSPVVRRGYRVGVPAGGYYREVLNTDSSIYGGSNQGNGGGLNAEPIGWNGMPCSLSTTLPPLGVVYFEAPS